ncbi:hypothetical protein VSDG_05984 [Cytospora chrysosperma]|uniref:UBZ4-type domain-containing protein n=1 Tax=Cytospora chrysosperma TaxID=252740 RepID=A0A423VTV2_CYTCH|nr:hypothetical protein VSDG_05984 [Valsa sordida]
MSTRRHPPVPTISQVIPGAAVNIVLKADQPTGRTVQGVVRDVLTRGNHPRGIKVRLADGRVGRVQNMASQGGAAASSSSAMPDLGGVGASSEQGQSYDAGYGSAGRPPRKGGKRGGRGGYESRGYDDEPDLPSQQIGLDAYVKQVKPKRAGKGNGKGKSSPAGLDDEQDEQAAAGSQAPAETVACPVCGTFEGDETAVAHHVAAHFDSGS